MNRAGARLRNVHVIVATSVGLVLLVATTLAWLGWRLLSQEARQQSHDRVEQSANALLTGVERRINEAESALSRIDTTALSSMAGGSALNGAVLVSFSQAGVQVEPPGSLVYQPATPPFREINRTVFEDENVLEHQILDLKAAAASLSALAGNKDPLVQAEALFRLARVQNKLGQKTDAVAAYDRLANVKLVNPDLEEPYGLAAQLKRCELLAELGQQTQARQEASAALTDLASGRWPVTKGIYDDADDLLRKIAGDARSSPDLDAKLALAEEVEKLWNEWQNFQNRGLRSLTKHLHESGRIPVVALMNENQERLAAAIYVGDSVRHLALDAPEGYVGAPVEASLADEQGQVLFGKTSSSSEVVVRPLAAVELPWQLNVGLDRANIAAGFAPARRSYIIILAAIIVLVSLACYAIARGVLREAAAGRLQSDFVSAVSHEFRSPLTTLRQLTELLAEGRIQDENRRRLYFTTLQKETVRLYQLVEDLLDFGRMDAGRRQYRIEPLDFSELVRDGVEEYARQSNGGGHRIELSSADAELPVHADREALRRVVRNLVENAVKYSPDAHTVWVETCCEDRSAVLRVRDQGIGIPPEERLRIFDKFVRGEAAKQACIQGTGIGLAMVKEIVRVHRGAIDVDSAVGRGSTFMVRLPLS